MNQNTLSTNVQAAHISEYDYPLPDERIAKYPLAERDASKLLLYRKSEIGETIFRNLPEYLPKGALMVFNNTRVIFARLHFQKATGATIEVFCLEPHTPADYQLSFSSRESVSWTCLIGNQKRWKEGVLTQVLHIGDKDVTLCAERHEPKGTGFEVRFSWDAQELTFAEILDAAGQLPIPPYLNRATEKSDLTTYQTVYSRIKGSVAAPTAGLHFTPRVLESLREHGIEQEEVTLHVGAGTFRPVKSDTIGGHEMHSEQFEVHRETLEALLRHDGHCIAVGTTSVRTLESLYFLGVKVAENPNLETEKLHVEQWEPYNRDYTLPTCDALRALITYMDRHELNAIHAPTQIIIAPGYTFRIVKAMLTNFHQPQSTLLLLVSAFVGDEKWRSIYRYALNHDFRFLSYGDSSLLMP